ncbi:hypothetical protein FXO37_00136 [Capsicum annuum]|nr:hypothetical protein FXO37_00136 [Capsicum annuum]
MEEEHKLFLLGLHKVGKEDWREISRNFVKTRAPTQVASHGQKYFLRRTNPNPLRRRSSHFDITTDSVYHSNPKIPSVNIRHRLHSSVRRQSKNNKFNLNFSELAYLILVRILF